MSEQTDDRQGRRYSSCVPWLVFGALLAGLYWPLLCGRVPAFRDGFHFYYPLLQWLDDQAGQGNYFPHYNPADGTGINLIGETSTALFYPGRLVFGLPGLSLPQRLGLFLYLHTIIAAAGAAYAGRRAGLGPAAQALAAVSYGLSCPVFFQHTNPIFLVGAAWTPWAVAECWILGHAGLSDQASSKAVRWPVWTAASSLALLGGDPQATVHIGLVTGLALLLSAVQSRRWRSSLWQAGQASLAVLAVMGLTAVQWIPSWYWLQHTSAAPSVVSAVASPAASSAASPAALQRDQVPELLGPAVTAAEQSAADREANQPRGSRYAFSLAPWHLATLVWGSLGGYVLPVNARLCSFLPAEPLMWIPSLTIGLPGILLAIVALLDRRLRMRTRYEWCIVLLAGGAMLGNYAPMWLLRNLLGMLGQSSWASSLPGDETLGIYWLLTEVVPTYGGFRYPAKWSVLFALGLSLVAAQALDDLQRIGQSLRAWSWWLCLISLSGAGLMAAITWGTSLASHLSQWASQLPADPWLGPLQAGPALRSATLALLVGGLLAGLMRVVTHLSWSRASTLIVALAAIELVLLDASWLFTVAPVDVQNVVPGSSSRTERWLRVWAPVGQANLQRDVLALQAGDGSQVEAICNYQRAFLLGKLHLLAGEPPVANLSALLSLPPQALMRVRRELAAHDHLRPSDDSLDQALAWLGVSHRLIRSPEAARRVSFQEVPESQPWVSAVGSHANTLHVKYLQASHLRIEVEGAQPIELTIRLYQDGGWLARFISDDGQVRSVRPYASHLGLFQRLDLPPGRWRVELNYTAPGFYVGLSLTLAAAVFILAARRKVLPGLRYV